MREGAIFSEPAITREQDAAAQRIVLSAFQVLQQFRWILSGDITDLVICTVQ
jgi:hypothetical protein